MAASQAAKRKASRAWSQTQRRERVAREAARIASETSALPLVQAARERDRIARERLVGGGVTDVELAQLVRGTEPADWAGIDDEAW